MGGLLANQVSMRIFSEGMGHWNKLTSVNRQEVVSARTIAGKFAPGPCFLERGHYRPAPTAVQ
jgi:hypothetical protein